MFRNRTRRTFVAAVLTVALAGCATMEANPNTTKGAAIGTVAGAGTGAAIGAIVGGGKGAAQGAAIGAVVGLLGGGLVGNYMDRQAKDMQAVLAEQDRLRRQQDQLAISLSSDVLFSSGSATIQPGAQNKLRQMADVLNKYPQTTVQITGYTDSRGSEASNVELSKRRAEAVASAFVADGVNPARISTYGQGEAMPVADNSTPEGRAQNRRVEIVINPDQNLRNEQQGGAAPASEPH
jgi:outer membrane protein OmpA-like peptidoglycan-associated protein